MTRDEIRSRLFAKLERPERLDRVGRHIDYFLIVLIIVNIFASILATVESIHTGYPVILSAIEYFSVFVFTLEYIARVWTSVENPELQGHGSPRLKYMLSPMAIVDMIAILPFYLSFFVTIDLRFLRVLRLLRVFKLTRYSIAMTMLLDVFREEATAFFAAFFILLVMLILAASGAYLVEHQVQPDKFSSIPSAMWWAMATLTTVGYGDVAPITAAGQFFGALVMVIGIGMAAIPAGILASGMSDQMRRNREEMSDKLKVMLEDGVIDYHEETELEIHRKALRLSRRVAQEIREEVVMSREKPHHLYCRHCGEQID